MRIAIERRPSGRERPNHPELVEIVTPRTNAAVITPAENLLAAISLSEPFSLEIAATAEGRWFLARAGSPAMRHHLENQLGVAYPQAELRRLDLTRFPGLDPARHGPHEQAAACTFTLRAPPYLPLRTFRDTEVDATRAAQADPVLGILGALGGLPEGWRALSQVVLRPAPDDWCRGYLHLAIEHPLARERVAARGDTSLTSVFAVAGLLVVGVAGVQAFQWYDTGAWLDLGLLVGGTVTALPGLLWLIHRLADRPVYDVQLVQEKVSRIAYTTQLRLAVFAPAAVPLVEVRACLGRLASSYRQFNLAAGNGLMPRPIDLRGHDLTALAPLPSRRAAFILNTRELAGLWHLPQGTADVALLERTTARRRLPLPATVAQGCRIGVSTHQGRTVPAALPDALLRRHLLLVAKTRRGKSSLLLRIARHLIVNTASAEQPALVLVDPHRDLARAALGLVPERRWPNVVYLDLTNLERPFGLNLLDTGLGWDRDRAVGNTLTVFQREFDRFWGPRMEDAFRFALLTLYDANQAICAAEPDGRRRQYTLLDVPPLLIDPAFRRNLLGLVTDPAIKAWWSGYFDRLDRRLQIEIVNPVQTKVQRFTGSQIARAIVGQPCSTIDPASWLRQGAIVIVNTAKGAVGEDTAALIGATLLNLTALAIGEQATIEVRQRRPVTLLVDEFHSMPGADYEAILSELAKYGANLVLATQSLARLEAVDRLQHRALRATVFANLDGLFAFQTSAEDASYLVRELGGGLDVQDLVELGDFQCYARLSMKGERLPSFSVHLDPPPASDTSVADRLAMMSVDRCGRERSAVERDLQSALVRIELTHQTTWEQISAGQPDAGVTREGVAMANGQNQKAGLSKGRSQNRPKGRHPEEQQSLPFDPSIAPENPPDCVGLVGGADDRDMARDEDEKR